MTTMKLFWICAVNAVIVIAFLANEATSQTYSCGSISSNYLVEVPGDSSGINSSSTTGVTGTNNPKSGRNSISEKKNVFDHSHTRNRNRYRNHSRNLQGGGSTVTTFRRTIEKSTSSTLCVLLRVTLAPGVSARLDQVSRTSNLSDYHIVPVSRSYAGHGWERVGGPYAQDLTTTCASSTCDLDIPILPNLQDGTFYLMSSAYSISNDQAAVSRFFRQTTFGPNLDMINSWNYGGDTLNAMAAWVQSQINEGSTAPTYHREYYRSRVGGSFGIGFPPEEPSEISEITGTHHPCDQNSHWLRMSFRVDDFGKSITATQRTSNTMLLSINGVPRTVVSTWQSQDGEDLGEGAFIFDCWNQEFKLNGIFRIRNPANEDCVRVKDGNPPINLPFSSDLVKTVNLPSQSLLGPTKNVYFANFFNRVGGEAYYLSDGFWSDECNALSSAKHPCGCRECTEDILETMAGAYTCGARISWLQTSEGGSMTEEEACTRIGNVEFDTVCGPMCDPTRCTSQANDNIIGSTEDGTQYIYGGFIKLDENTLKNVKGDGGGDFRSNGVDKRCANPFMTFTNSESCFLSYESNVCSTVHEKKNVGDPIVVCGSPGESGNGDNRQNTFNFLGSSGGFKFDEDYEMQKGNTWSMIALESDDQLRQRMAWALSQILAISPNQIDEARNAENFLNYYDIFVRNAFGNYFDILKEVSYSPMMGEMLSFLDSKSTSFVLKDTGNKAFPDENFAREIMQLFTVGVHKLNMDGTVVMNSSGDPVATYDNTDIQNFARAWTGFTRLPRRANIENFDWDYNRIDPMRINAQWRDTFPKTDLDGNYIGDTYPLCKDLPSRQFLRKAAKYRLLGASTISQLHYERRWNYEARKALILNSSSELYSELCNGSGGNCNFQAEVTLTSNISSCNGDECFVDELRLIQVQIDPPVYYEYIRPPCVDLAFYNTGKTIQLMWEEYSMCANSALPIARDACCDNPQFNNPPIYSRCYHSSERTTFETGKERCDDVGGTQCAWTWVDTDMNPECQYYSEDAWYWTTDQACILQAKVSSTGTVAMVHNPNLIDARVTDVQVSRTNTNYFKVSWERNEYPKPSNSCGSGTCELISPTECLCDISIEDTAVFTSIPSVEEVVSNLHVGGADITRFDGEYTEVQNVSGVTVYNKNSVGYTSDTVFKVYHRGTDRYFKNLRSTIRINNSFAFRNPPQFLNPAMHEPRDAMYETDAVLEHLFYHDNMPPFLALRLIQRFEISNPSPRCIEAVAEAFKTGFYSSSGQSYGDGRYGNLASTIAAIVLDREARSVLLDADPTSGALREPMLKFISFMRAMEFQQTESAPELRLLDLQGKIGQAPHSIPNVFSFFLSEYSAPGVIKAASITSPEAQVLSGPKIISFLNGMISLVDWGLMDCWGGFGETLAYWCDGLTDEYYNYYDPDDNMRGGLMYAPNASKNTAEKIDELALLLTGGRLHDEAKGIIINAYNLNGGGVEGLRAAQKLMTTVPEFHSTNIVDTNTLTRPDIDVPEPSSKAYKALLFLNLSGGSDSFNMLVPKSECSGKDMYQHYSDIRSDLAVPLNDLLDIDASTSDQICSTFGINPDLPILKTFYDGGELLWVSNMGILQKLTTKETWWEDTSDTSLFAHNFQQREVQNMDIYESQVGRGVGGRMVDVLKRLGYNAASISMGGIADALVADDVVQLVVDSGGSVSYDPRSEVSPLLTDVKSINADNFFGSSLFSETWSSFLNQGLGESALIDAALQSVTLGVDFSDNDFSAQLGTVAKMMKSKDSRGTDRDIFYVEQSGFDTHDNMIDDFSTLLKRMNTGIEEFKTEMDNQGLWDSVTVVMVSEFARTLPVNTGNGSDHAWGGNYFIAGGDVKGKQILGTYPTDLDDSGAEVFEPGIVIPTTSWDSLWQGVSQWLGISNSGDLNEVLPNRNSFSNLFDMEMLYKSNSGTCSDSAGKFQVIKPDPGWTKMKNCEWVKRRSTAWRCKFFAGTKEGCPKTCTNCCEDTKESFNLLWNGKTKTCAWASKNIAVRCKKPPVRQLCAVICGEC